VQDEAEKQAYPSRRYAWWLVVLLTIAYVFSFTDRIIISLLVEPIKADLNLSDAEIGLLLGPAFAIFYATMGLPFGWLADRWRRTWIVGAGILVWSMATLACGLARNFTQLFVARMTVGIGEATLSPCATSMMADSFPPERRGKPIAVYSMGIVLGSSAAFLIGAVFIELSQRVSVLSFPLVGELAPWQIVFVALGIAGILPALPFFFWREPPRIAVQADANALSGTGLPDMLRYVAKHWPVYVTFVSLMCAMTTIVYATSTGFNAALFSRTYGWPAEKFALYNGILTLPLGLSTYALAGWASDRWTRRGRRDAPLIIMCIGAVIMVPLYAAMPLMPNGWAAFIVLNAGGIGVGMMSAVSVTALLNITPDAVRAQLIALYYMTISLTGLFLGPTTVGYLSAKVFGEENLNLAMAVLPVIFGVVPLLLIPVTRRLYLVHMRRLDSTVEPDGY